MDTEKAILERLQVLSGFGCLIKLCCMDDWEPKTLNAVFFCVIDGWIDDFMSTMHQTLGEKQEEVQTYLTPSSSNWTELLSTVLACYSTYPYPLFRDRPRLFDPTREEYTKLHATICARTEYKFDPAMCLVCSTLLNAGGMRHCSLHSQSCNGADGGGVFFLLQECTVLLCSGYRCAYFPTPYVDNIYGESHDSFRGKPLHLDNSIYGMINNMWLEHKISQEIFSIITSSNRLIILGYYWLSRPTSFLVRYVWHIFM